MKIHRCIFKWKDIHGNCLAQKNIEICLGFDFVGLADHPQYHSMRELHEALKAEYAGEDKTGGNPAADTC